MSHLEKRANRWYAVLTIPEDVRHQFGGKLRFVKSTGTTDKRAAQVRAFALVAEWKAEIESARGNVEPNSILELASAVRAELDLFKRRGDSEQHEAVSFAVSSMAEKLADQGRATEAHRLTHVAFGAETLIKPELEEWKSSLHLKEKTTEQMEKDANLMAEFFEVVEAVTPEKVRAWAKLLMEAKEEGGYGYGTSSVKRTFTASRSVWRHLQERGLAPAESEPFKLPSFVQRQNKSGSVSKRSNRSWHPFKPAEVVMFYSEALANGDTKLADLIKLGMYTGARIEELCSLEVEECSTASLMINDSKTPSGIREVPVHPEITGLVGELLASSSDGYLLSGLTFNKYGDRSNAIGKRFGRMKTKHGFGPLHVFHSIRKTVVTLLEDAGVSENMAADIVGHEKPRITYGLYSGGHSLRSKMEAIKLLQYPK
ncbi:DUF6538 domain-containing protein [Billgrantia antri]|uniref:Tyrosine-type recombinase/integrase n=1 Tax=Billgrantia antri TaxID=2846777 RepID=A0ABS6ZP13_9GAMM|nr:DUF6538 domain-containing protein [Halomonas antri]MBW6391807.1 tyrosine-type recombinase/integrase [Halomonas antri]